MADHRGRDEWDRVDELFAAALDLDPDERGAFLDSACEGEPGLRSEVEALLEAAEEADGLVARSSEAVAEAVTEALARSPSDLPPGHRIGAYRLVRRIARGGMGTVYLARRADGRFEQSVALKVLRRGLDTADVLARFRAERQILASLSHPNIARLLDGGATDDGRPYLVMEHIEGEPVDVYCDQNCLPLEERLRLFRKICEAVSHAHRKLVVHRDLKPSNVLVTEEGEPKLLDFGIAKLLDPDEAVAAAPVTRTGVRLLSPHYASPEQVEGRTVTTATDVYALGVMLYELVTGHHPHEGDPEEHRTAEEVERAIAEEPPMQPEAAVKTSRKLRGPSGSVTERSPEEIAEDRDTRPEDLRRRVAGELGLILLKALRKEPERRYASAESLSQELERFLAGRPISARSATLRYRLSKFVRRHADAVAAAGLVLVALLGGVAATAWQARRASRAAEDARLEARNAEQVTELLVGMFESSDAPEAAVGDTLTARAVLDRGVDRVREELAGQPEVRARMLHVAGRVYRNLGLYEPARSLLREALELRRELHQGPHPEVAATLDDLATALRLERDFVGAVPVYREALEMHRALHPDTSLAVVNAAADLALNLRDVGRADTAVAIMREVLELKRRRVGHDHQQTLKAQTALAYVLRAQDELAEAESLYRNALPRMRRAGAGPDWLAEELNNLAYLVKVDGRPGEAADLYRDALAESRRAEGADHPTSLTVMNNLAAAHEAAGDTARAEEVLRRKLRLTRTAYPDGHWRVGSAARALATVHTHQGEYREAERYYREELDVYRSQLGDAHDWTAGARGRLGECLVAQGRYPEAESLLLRSRTDLEEALGPGARQTRGALERLVELYEAWGREAEARRYRERLAGAGSESRDGS